MSQIIPSALHSAERVLFVFDLSVRDFLYLQNYIFKLKIFYPQLKVDLWVNSVSYFFQHRNDTQEKFLYDFLQECKFVDKIYFDYYPSNLKGLYSYKYPFIVSFSSCFKVFRLIRRVSSNCFLIGIQPKIYWYNFVRKRDKRLLNRSLLLNIKYTSRNSFYLNFFNQLLNEDLLNEGFDLKRVELEVPNKWISYAKLRFLKWGIDRVGKKFGNVFFINPFDDTEKCIWSLNDVLKFVTQLKRQDTWGDVYFILYVPERRAKKVKDFFATNSINNLLLFFADYNFFQIPSVLGLCDVVIAADGFCIDLANILNVHCVEIKLNQKLDDEVYLLLSKVLK